MIDRITGIVLIAVALFSAPSVMLSTVIANPDARCELAYFEGRQVGIPRCASPNRVDIGVLVGW